MLNITQIQCDQKALHLRTDYFSSPLATVWSASTLPFSSGSMLPEYQRSKRRSPVARELSFDGWTWWLGFHTLHAGILCYPPVLMSLAWGPPSSFSRRAQRSCTICQLYSDCSDTPKSKKIFPDYVSATVSHPWSLRSVLKLESESTCRCVHVWK